MKKTMKKLLFELLKDSSRSDRTLAKVLGVSQATVSRMRNKLVRDGLIQQFTIVPELTKIGLEILAITVFRSKRTEEIREKATKWTMAKPNIIFAARAEGMGKNAVVISIHKDYTDYSNFLNDIMFEGKDILEDHDTLLVSLRGFIAKPFSLKYLAELCQKS